LQKDSLRPGAVGSVSPGLETFYHGPRTTDNGRLRTFRETDWKNAGGQLQLDIRKVELPKSACPPTSLFRNQRLASLVSHEVRNFGMYRMVSRPEIAR
jgi:hypothetical protein